MRMIKVLVLLLVLVFVLGTPGVLGSHAVERSHGIIVTNLVGSNAHCPTPGTSVACILIPSGAISATISFDPPLPAGVGVFACMTHGSLLMVAISPQKNLSQLVVGQRVTAVWGHDSLAGYCNFA